jgi:hypothetical protein
MRCATLTWYPHPSTQTLVLSKIRELLKSKANANYSYRGCTIFEAAILSRSDYSYEIICLLQQYGCKYPLSHQLLNHNHRRGLIESTIAQEDPRISRLVLHGPLGSPWERADASDFYHWDQLLDPALLSDTINDVVSPIPPNDDREDNNNNNKNDSKLERASTSAVILGGMGRTVGVDGGYNWPQLTNHAIATASLEGTTAHVIPWLIWAYGVDIKRVTRLTSTEFGTSELWSLISPKWSINQIIEYLDADGFDDISRHYIKTGATIVL